MQAAAAARAAAAPTQDAVAAGAARIRAEREHTSDVLL